VCDRDGYRNSRLDDRISGIDMLSIFLGEVKTKAVRSDVTIALLKNETRARSFETTVLNASKDTIPERCSEACSMDISEIRSVRV
jgi:hypothetical protein